MPSPIVSQFKRFSQAEKAEYAKRMSAQEEHKAVNNKSTVSKLSTAYKQVVERQRKELGL